MLGVLVRLRPPTGHQWLELKLGILFGIQAYLEMMYV